jgi:lipid-A-disaccharide synthase-like uncharacterized protein
MDWLTHLLCPGGKFLGVAWSVWKVVGWTGNVIFSARFLVQWYATEKRRQVVVPELFWWLSLAGSLLLLFFAVFSDRNPVFIFAYAFNWIPYFRNLLIHRRHEQSQIQCSACGHKAPGSDHFCAQCGAKLAKGPPLTSKSSS